MQFFKFLYPEKARSLAVHVALELSPGTKIQLPSLSAAVRMREKRPVSVPNLQPIDAVE